MFCFVQLLFVCDVELYMFCIYISLTGELWALCLMLEVNIYIYVYMQHSILISTCECEIEDLIA